MMGIDKKACREHLIPARAPDPNNGLFLVRSLKYIICTQVKIIGHRRLLILYLYAREKGRDGQPVLAFTMFQATDAFTTYAHGTDVKTRWRDAMLLNLDRRDYYFSPEQFAFYTEEDEQRVLSFFRSLKKRGNWETGIDAMQRVQEDIREDQLRRRICVRKRKIRDRMKGLRPLPGDLNRWLRREVLPAYFFYDAKRGNQPMEGVCSACGHTVVVERAKHNAAGTCPRCGRTFTMKSNGRRGYLWDRVTASVVQKYEEDKLIVRIVKGSYTARRGEKGYVDCYEETRVIVGMDQKGEPFEEAYHNGFGCFSITPWEKGYPPVMYLYQQNFNAETCGYLYCRNLDRELAGTPWQYCQLKAFYEGVQDQMQVVPYLKAYRMIPAIEFFVKLKLYWLVTHLVYKTGYIGAYQVIDPQGKNLRQILRIEPADVAFLQRSGAKVETLQLLQAFRAEGHQPDAAFFDWAEQHGVCDKRFLQRALHYTTPYKVMRYLNRQFAARKASSRLDHSGVASDYRDYLGFCERLHYDLKDEFILFPRDLKQTHDQAQRMVRFDEVKQYDQQISGAFEQMKRQYQFASQGLIVLPPHTAGEIVAEGQTLHHCVGGYVEQVVKGDCAILFLRKKEARDIPFYTVEVKDDRVVQVRGDRNCAPTPEVWQFLDAWTKKKHLEEAA